MIYRAVGNILMDHKLYQAGDEIELTAERAAQMAHAVEGPIAQPVKVEDPPAAKPNYKFQKRNKG